MCANCVAQASLYVGASLGGLRVMGARARARRGPGRLRSRGPATADPVTGPDLDDPTGPRGRGTAIGDGALTVAGPESGGTAIENGAFTDASPESGGTAIEDGALTIAGPDTGPRADGAAEPPRTADGATGVRALVTI